MSDSTNGDCLNAQAAIAYAQGCVSTATGELIKAHTEACPNCFDLVAAAFRGLDTGSWTSETEAAATRFQEGMLVANRFEVRRFVAKGAMGEVYEVLDRELDTVVALKTVATIASNSSRAEKYLRGEAASARSIAHPNVCRIYEWGTHLVLDSDSKIHFFTMEFVRGRRLGTLLREEGPLSVTEAFEVARQLLAGLSAAHGAGILHRDFKSDNVILSEKDGTPRAVILDFGLARPLHLDLGSSTVRVEGTRLYMAPEQHQGQPLAASADIYAFGVVLFEMLTGRRPFQRDDGTEPPLACLTENPIAPRRLNRRIPAKLERFVLRCLRRNSFDRFQSAKQALAALDACAPALANMHRSQRAVLSIAAALALTVPAMALLAFIQSKDPAPSRAVSSMDGGTLREAERVVRAPSAPPVLEPIPTAPASRILEQPPEPVQTLKASSAAPRPPARSLVKEQPQGATRTAAATAPTSSSRGSPSAEPSFAGTWEPFEGPIELTPQTEPSATPRAELETPR